MDKATKRGYYLKELPRLPKTELFGADYFMGRTSDYEGGILEGDRWEYYRWVAQKVARRKPASVLEVGCAIGYVVKELLKLGIDAAGVDISPWAVQHRLTPNVTLADANALPFWDKQFDLIFSHDFLEHIPYEELHRVFGELERVGKRNYHIVSCGSLPDDRDITHVTMKPITWWRALMPSFEFERKR